MINDGHSRSRDRTERVYDFMSEILVECPRCGACAVHRRMPPDQRGPRADTFTS